MLKRVMAVFLSICICMSVIPMSVFAASPRQTILYGDADNSGKVDLQDLLLIEKYIEEEENLTVNEKNADINADGVIDKTDAELLREYLAGNLDTLTPVLCTVTFDTADGGAMEPIAAGKGYPYQGTIPTPSKENELFVGWIKQDGEAYYQTEDVIASNMTLTAVYSPVEAQQTLSITSFSLDDQPTDVSFVLKGDFASATEVEANLTLVPKDGSDPVQVAVKDNGDGTYTVNAPKGFTPGASYELTLKNDGLSFADKDEMFRTVYFIIKKAEVDNLKFNADIVFLRDTDEMKYTIDGKTTDVLESDLLSNDESKEDIVGTFPMTGNPLAVGAIVCIYEYVAPNNRDYTKNDYEDDALAYIRITSVTGNIYGFESLDEEDYNDVLAVPDTIPYSVKVLPTAAGTVNKNDYDGHARAKLGLTDTPEFNVYDILVFYTGSYDKITQDTPSAYGQVTEVNGDTVSYKLVTKNDIENFSGMFVQQEIDGEELLEEIDQEKLLSEIKQQAEDSGFIEEASAHMARSAFETEDIKNALRKNGVSDGEIGALAENPTLLAAGGAKKTKVVVEGVTVVPTFILANHFENGIGIGLEVTLTLSVDTKISATKTSSLKIELTAGFEQELALGFDVSVDKKVKWYLFIPVLKELYVNIAVDIQNYSFVSVGAKIYTVSDDISKKTWKALTEGDLGSSAPPKVKNALRQINMLGAKAKRLKKNIDAAKELQEQINGYMQQLPKVNMDGVEYSYAQLQEALGAEDVSTSFDEVFSAETEAENKVGLEQLMNRYKEMLNQESDWVEVFNQQIFAKEFHIKVVAINVGVNFIIRGNVNIAIGADLEYQVGKRYNFWIHLSDNLKKASSGSSEFDLIDERFAFQFYVMGTLGLQIGIKADLAVGLFSTKIASIGANVEFGPYLKIWGYFIYIYEQVRPVNTPAWNEKEEMLGALYLEFGLYVKVNLKLQVFDNALKYEPTLYNGEFPLVTAGAKRNVYDFVLNSDKNDALYVKDSDGDSTNGITMQLPSRYQNMRTIDMVSGDKRQFTYPRDKYMYTTTDSRFTVDENGVITVKPGVTDRLLNCDLRIVWKCDKVAFSKYDTDITVPLVWTNMTEAEQNEKFTASVKVGNSTDGYQTVWSSSVTRLDTFDLPTEDEILALIDFDSYNTEDGANLKYSEIAGFGDSKTTGLTITADTSYYFDVTQRKITLTVNGVQNADGTTESRVFDTTYGKPFDLSELTTTGKNNDKTSEYTAFKNLTDAQGNEFDFDTAANLIFAQKYGDSATVTANYQSETLTATYEFVGIGNVPPVTVKFKKGAIPYFDGLNNYVAEHGGAAAKVIGMTPGSAPVESYITYTVTCANDPDAQPLPKHTISFDTKGGNTIKPQEYEEGSIIFRPTDPIRAGYTFGGWYSDAALSTAFDFEAVMPSQDITAYAKWTANTYTVTLMSQNTPVDTITATYDKPYGALKSPEKEADFKFIGWYTKSEGGTLVQADTVYSTAGNQTLYAHWEEKQTIDLTAADIAYTNQTVDFKEDTTRSFDFTLKKHSVIKDDMTVKYRQQLPGGAFSDWSGSLPLNAGTYDVRLTFEGNDDYKAMAQEIMFSGVIRINKIHLFPDDEHNWAPQPVIYTAGGVAQACRSDGIKGDGAVTYELTKHVFYSDTDDPNKFHESFLVGTNSSGFFTNLSPYGASGNIVAITYTVVVKVAEGTNYFGTKSWAKGFSAAGCNAGPYRAEFEISTTDGTDSDILGGVHVENYRLYEETKMNSRKEDFDAGRKDSYVVASGLVPWQITEAYIYKSGNRGIKPAWSFTSNFQLKYGDKVFSKEFVSGHLIGKHVRMPQDFSGKFKRQVFSTGNFSTGGASTIDLSSNEKYTYSYNGQITDQFMEGYDARQYYDSPTFTVSSERPVYDQFIKHTGVTSFEIDTAGLAEYLRKFGGEVPEYTVTLGYAPETFINTSRLTKTIEVINAPVSANSQLSAKTTAPAGTPQVAMPMLLSTAKSGGTAVMSFNADEMTANRGKTFDLPIQLDGNQSLWGILAGVQFDTDVLELTGCTAGGIFEKEQFTLQNNLSKAPYKFLATRDTLDAAEANGTLATLHFRVKDDAKDGNSTISISLLEASDTAGAVSIEKGKGSNVIVDGTAPVIVGDADGKTFCGETEFIITDANMDTVTVNEKAVTVAGGTFTVYPAEGIQTIVLTDKAGNTTTVKVTVNSGHTWGDWKHDADGHWRECSCCGHIEKAEHAFTWIIDKAATETQSGLKHEECTVCKYKRDENTVLPVSGNSNSPSTGDNSNMLLWICLLFVSGRVLTGFGVARKRKKYTGK